VLYLLAFRSASSALFALHTDKSNATDIVNTAEAEMGKPIERTEEK
jgi:hypothetical protein